MAIMATMTQANMATMTIMAARTMVVMENIMMMSGISKQEEPSNNKLPRA
jgi:hypothetical protein